MNIGRLDRRVVIQSRTPALDSEGLGEDVGTWADSITVWAQVTAAGGGETAGGAQRYAEAEKRFRIRWRTGITPENRLSFDGRVYDILAVDELGRREGLEILAKSRAEVTPLAPN